MSFESSEPTYAASIDALIASTAPNASELYSTVYTANNPLIMHFDPAWLHELVANGLAQLQRADVRAILSPEQLEGVDVEIAQRLAFMADLERLSIGECCVGMFPVNPHTGASADADTEERSW